MSTLQEQVTESILAELEKGTMPWVKPWAFPIPQNAVTRTPYSGINILLLWSGQYASNNWITFRQCEIAGCKIRKGEHGTRVIYAGKKTETVDGKEVIRRFVKWYYVWNTEQLEGYVETLPPVEYPEAEEFIKAIGVETHHAMTGACYVPSTDTIYMPPRSTFKEESEYWSTWLHEHIHWTGPRLERRFGKFGDQDYAYEELVAEMGGAFLCASLGMKSIQRHAEYISHWIRLVKDRKNVLFSAASKASRAASYLWAMYQDAKGEVHA